MKKLFLCLLIASTFTFAQVGKIGVGLHSGLTTGFSASYWNTNYNFFNVNLSYNFAKEGRAILYVDYNRCLSIFDMALPLYYGLGVQVKPFHLKDEEGTLSLKVNFGIQTFIFDNKFDLFLNLSPTFHIVPDSNTEMVFLLGARYYL